ncbi:hypothetical protein Trydic_g15073 [Trypoxylus dichotomus]
MHFTYGHVNQNAGEAIYFVLMLILIAKSFHITEETISGRIEKNPEAKLRKISAKIGISAPLVWRIFHEQQINDATGSEPL